MMLILATLILEGSMLGSSNLTGHRQGDVQGTQAGARPVQEVEPFLFPPFPGSAEQGSVFDHSSPNYTQIDQRIVAFTGDEASRKCPLFKPAGASPPGGNCDAGFGGYWSFDLGDWLYYDGHDGIDYGISYRPVYAAADADRVLYAGWWDPQNHRAGLGLYVRLGHPNGYITTYGHLSAIAVQTCPTPGCLELARGEIIGTSGNTGNSIGPHLHFNVLDPLGRPVDPYGWQGDAPDPWAYNQSESLWVSSPALIYARASTLPSGPEMDYPARIETGILVDDASTRFTGTPVSCWKVQSVAPGYAVNGSMRSARAQNADSDCIGRWIFPEGAEPGAYAVYIRIPSSHATSEGAVYTIRHTEQVSKVLIDQVVFPNQFGISDGWVYSGKYDFGGQGGEYVELTNQTQDEPARVDTVEVGADAVRFVPVAEAPPAVFATHTPPNSELPDLTETAIPAREEISPGTATSSITATPLPTLTPVYILVNVYFVDKYRLERNLKPVEQPGLRWSKSNRLARTVLDEYFRGPGSSERTEFGWIGIYNGFTGYSKFELQDGVAHVYLKGTCAPDGLVYTIADALKVNLKQFDEISYVKLYDQNGDTQSPDGLSDSIPTCLKP